jgi:DNA-binding NarL/FixJ family response regulator
VYCWVHTWIYTWRSTSTAGTSRSQSGARRSATALRSLIERYAVRDSQSANLHRDLSTLTPRELEVLQLLARS